MVMNRCNIGFLLLFLGVLSCSGEDAPQGGGGEATPPPDVSSGGATTPDAVPSPPGQEPQARLAPPPSPPTVETVEQLTVAVGETRRVTTSQLISKRAVTLNGDFVFEVPASSATREVKLVVEEGDLVANGTISVALQPSEGQTVGERLKRLFFSTAVAQQPPNIQTLQGGSDDGISVLVEVVKGNFLMGENFQLKSFDGRDAPARSLATLGSEGRGYREAKNGGNGGDIILKVWGDTVLSGIALKPRFILGNGGRGETVIVNDASFSNEAPQPEIQIAAGRGGESGELRLETRSVQSTNGASPVLIEGDAVVRHGAGGRGGNVIWDVGDGHEFTRLQRIVVIAGKGGDGALRGGQGGHVKYYSDKVIHAAGPAPTVHAIAGNGGDINPFVPFTAPGLQRGSGLVRAVKAGDGGLAFIRGNRGRDGANIRPEQASATAGTATGNIEVMLGNGGHVKGDWSFFPLFTSGGRGGYPGDFALLQGELQERYLGSVPATSGERLRVNIADPFIAGSTGGRGGNGCVDPARPRPGGAGGDSANIIIRLGNGGDGPAPGSGGRLNVEQLRLPSPGSGGHGTPVGVPGAIVSMLVNGGDGGRGFNDRNQGTPGSRGEQGQLIGELRPDLIAQPGSLCNQLNSGQQPNPSLPYVVFQSTRTSNVSCTTATNERRTIELFSSATSTFTPARVAGQFDVSTVSVSTDREPECQVRRVTRTYPTFEANTPIALRHRFSRGCVIANGGNASTCRTDGGDNSGCIAVPIANDGLLYTWQTWNTEQSYSCTNCGNESVAGCVCEFVNGPSVNRGDPRNYRLRCGNQIID